MFQDYKIAYLRKHVKVRRAVPFTMHRSSLSYILGLGARQIPHAAMNTEVDLTPLMDYGKDKQRTIAESAETLNEEMLFKKAIHQNFSAFFVKAFSHALYHTPCMNAFFDFTPYRNGGTLYHAEDVNLGINVHTKFGVVRPVFRNAQLKPIEQVASELRDLSRRARNTDPEELFRGAAKRYLWPAIKECDPGALYPGYILLRSLTVDRYKPDPEYLKIPPEKKLAVEDILGATCSIANIGMMVPGHQTLTALTPPEVMMFGVGHLHLAPRYVDGKLVPRTVSTMCGTMDHRAYDAGEAFPFLKKLLEYIADPATIYEWKPGDDI